MYYKESCHVQSASIFLRTMSEILKRHHDDFFGLEVDLEVVADHIRLSLENPFQVRPDDPSKKIEDEEDEIMEQIMSCLREKPAVTRVKIAMISAMVHEEARRTMQSIMSLKVPFQDFPFDEKDTVSTAHCGIVIDAIATLVPELIRHLSVEELCALEEESEQKQTDMQSYIEDYYIRHG